MTYANPPRSGLVQLFSVAQAQQKSAARQKSVCSRKKTDAPSGVKQEFIIALFAHRVNSVRVASNKTLFRLNVNPWRYLEDQPAILLPGRFGTMLYREQQRTAIRDGPRD